MIEWYYVKIYNSDYVKLLMLINLNLYDFIILSDNFEECNRNAKNSALKLISDYCFILIASAFIFDR